MRVSNSRPLALTLAASTLTLCVQSAFADAAAAAADGSQQLESVVVSGDRVGTATFEAPTQGSLDAGEPQSIINQHFIDSSFTAGANYTDIITIAPSVSDWSPNGPGNAESLNLSIRGFQDGQFNVTFDGIPWGDSNDFTHHSTSYFTANTLDRAVIDRGPGTASQIGNATFGGTVALQSHEPTEARRATASLTLGSWRTNDLSAEVDTGTLSASGGRAYLAVTSINTDGAMSNNALARRNVLAKYVQPIDADTSLTAVAMYNTLHQNVSQMGATLQQMAQYGSHFSLGTTPSSEAYYGFNFDDIHTDFEYLQLRTRVSGVRIDDKLYSYAYYHRINETNDTSMLLGSKGAYDAANGNALASGDPTANDVAGQMGWNNYRSVGNLLRAEMDAGPGTVRAGLWYDYQWNDRVLYDVDWTQGGTLDTNGDLSGYQRLLHDDLTSMQAFVEYEFRPVETLVLTPGLRYSSFARKIDATVNPVTGNPSSSSNTWTAPQPSIYALWHPADTASVYAQYARGFLAPKDKLAFQPNQTAAKAIDAQHTTNLQAGGTWKTSQLTISADVYHIKFDNFFTFAQHGAAVAASGGGSAVFKGEELEGTWSVGAGVNLYGNATHNQQQYADGTQVQFAPNGTWSAGLIFDDHRFYASWIAKHVGQTWQAGNGTPGTGAGAPSFDAFNGAYIVPGFTTSDLVLGVNFAQPAAGLRNIRTRLKVANLSNNESIYYVYGATQFGGGTDMFMTLPGRSYMVTVSADF